MRQWLRHGILARPANRRQIDGLRFRGIDGANPSAGLTYLGRLFYGTTFNGGTGGDGAGFGTVFSLNPATGAERAIHSFAYLNDGNNPTSNLIAAGGELYGATEFGGMGGGTIFAVNKATGAEHLAISFSGIGPVNGNKPLSALIGVGGMLYGAAYGGGASGCGLVFALNPKTGAAKPVYSFTCGTDAIGPVGALLSVGSTFYGTSETGGTANLGTVYAVDRATGAERVVHSFTGGNDGLYPDGRLIAAGGLLYGTTSQGGSAGKGTVFSIDPATGAETILHTFQGGTDGADPLAGLTDIGGTLYGTARYGGSTNCAEGCGTVFAITP